ncbi:MAG: RNA polymerase sigma-70 factor, ECF subfamily [Microgenomates group bacterium LiPW_31]|nr:MAG: RNA polymerase sigma-70 factor, ECF subfamily [Microgenomates group bacterium LiPW_31]
MEKKRKEFSKIYDKHIEKIYRFIFVKVSSQEIAQDLCSETFLRGWEAYRKTENPGSEIRNIQAFLYQIARNLITDHYREKGRTEFVSPEMVSIVDPNPGIEEKMALSSDIDNIRTALVSLGGEYQDVIIYRYLDELSISEIAKIMEKSEGAVRVALHRALKSLRTIINKA